jgi:hypothetical protein
MTWLLKNEADLIQEYRLLINPLQNPAMNVESLNSSL